MGTLNFVVVHRKPELQHPAIREIQFNRHLMVPKIISHQVFQTNSLLSNHPSLNQHRLKLCRLGIECFDLQHFCQGFVQVKQVEMLIQISNATGQRRQQHVESVFLGHRPCMAFLHGLHLQLNGLGHAVEGRTQTGNFITPGHLDSGLNFSRLQFHGLAAKVLEPGRQGIAQAQQNH